MTPLRAVLWANILLVVVLALRIHRNRASRAAAPLLLSSVMLAVVSLLHQAAQGALSLDLPELR